MQKKKQSAGAKAIMQSVAALEACLADGGRPEHRFPSRIVSFPQPAKYSPASVKKLRSSLGMSQAAFAEMLGVSRILAQSWERGVREPSPLARRLLDTISVDPAAWLATMIDQRMRSRSA